MIHCADICITWLMYSLLKFVTKNNNTTSFQVKVNSSNKTVKFMFHDTTCYHPDKQKVQLLLVVLLFNNAWSNWLITYMLSMHD